MLHRHGRSTDKYGLPKVLHENTEYDRLLGAFDKQEMQELADQPIPQHTQEQKTVFDAITSSVIQQEGGVYMIDAPAGTGKTFTETTIAASLKSSWDARLMHGVHWISRIDPPWGSHRTFNF